MSSRIDPVGSPLLTDLYQLSMLQAYHAHGMRDTAVFELFVRKLPAERNFLVAAGLAQVLDFVERLRFRDDEIAWLRASGLFTREFIDELAGFRFTGDIHAMPEGTVFFADEPVLRITAPIAQAQLLETRLLNLVHFETLVASKAARCVLAACGKGLVDFGLRRAHGAEAGLLAARASYLAGFTGSSVVLAAPAYGIPIFGTMAHSFILAHASEIDAFERFARTFPNNAVLLVDTYDTVDGARKVVELSVALRARGITVRGVRLDSGDLCALAKEVRAVLDAGGLREAIIFASGNLDELRVAELLAAGAPIDSFGIGTSLVTSADVPALDAVYKLEEYAGRARRKRSTGKATWPGRKQVYRSLGADGRFKSDLLALEGEPQAGEPLLRLVMSQGERLAGVSLEEARARCADQLRCLPSALRALAPAAAYPVEVSSGLRALAAAVDRNLGCF